MSRMKRLMALFFSFIIVISAATISFGTPHIANAAFTIPDGSTVGGIDVGGMTVDEAKDILSDKINEWKNQSDMTIESPTEILTIPSEDIQYDLNQTMDQLLEKTKTPWYAFFIKKKSVDLPLVVKVNITDEELSEWPNHIDKVKTINNVETTASYLGEHNIQAVLTEANEQNDVIAEASWNIPKDYIFLDELVEELNGKKITPGNSFSFLQQVANEVSYFREDDGNFVVSMLYSLLLQTNVEIIERHSQRVIPVYSKAGIEAKVSQTDDKDFVVSNPGPYIYTIQAEKNGSKLKMAILSAPQKTKYQYKIENKEDIHYRTIYRYKKDLQPCCKRVIQNGVNGQRVEVYRVSVAENGAELSRELISTDFYLPVPEIILLALPSSENQNNNANNENDQTNSDDTNTNNSQADPSNANADHSTNTDQTKQKDINTDNGTDGTESMGQDRFQSEEEYEKQLMEESVEEEPEYVK